MKMEFKETADNLKLESENSLAQECLNEMLNGKIFFSSGFEQEKKRLTDLYKLRLRNAHQKEDLPKKNDLISWEKAIEDLKKSTAENLILNWIRTESKLFLLFWNSKSRKLEGIFYLYQIKSIEEIDKNNTETIKKGFSVISVKYEKGNLIKEWK